MRPATVTRQRKCPVSDPTLTFSIAGGPTLIATGPWTATYCASLERQTSAISNGTPLPQGVSIDISRVEQLDTLGAWLLERLIRQDGTGRNEPVLVGIPRPLPGASRKGA